MSEPIIGYGTTLTYFPKLNVDELLATMTKFKKERDENDAALVKALKGFIAKSGDNLAIWAQRLRIPLLEFLETLDGDRPVSWRFWEEIRRVFKWVELK